MKKLIRKIPHFKGKFRLARFVFRNYIQKSRDVIVQGKYGLTYKLPNLKEIIGLEIFADGIYEKETSDFIMSKLPEHGVFADIGANIGSIALPICRMRADIHAICIEASPRVFSYLRYNFDVNQLTNCTLVNKIVSGEELGLVNFYSPVELFGKGSMAPVFTQDAEKVESACLDRILAEAGIEKVNFIKLDIEGFEYHAFKGGGKLLSGAEAPDILFEFLDWAESQVKGLHAGAAQELLLAYGYRLYIIGGNGKLTRLETALVKGSEMLFASKKDQC